MTVQGGSMATPLRTICDELAERWPIDHDLAIETVSNRAARRRRMNLYGTTATVVAVLVGIGFVMARHELSIGIATNLIVAIVLATTAAVMGFLGNRSRRVAAAIEAGLADRGLCSVCPRCGGDPFVDRGCCRRFPSDWSEIDLYGFWHELSHIQSDHGDIERAYRRPRGSMGSSVNHPDGSSVLGAPFPRSLPLGKLAWMLLYAAVVWGAASTTSLDPVTRFIVLILAVAGMVSVLASLRIHAPAGSETHVRCAGCRYILRPPYVGRCPECGGGLGNWKDVTFDQDQIVFQGLDSRLTSVRRWLLSRLTSIRREG